MYNRKLLKFMIMCLASIIFFTTPIISIFAEERHNLNISNSKKIVRVDCLDENGYTLSYFDIDAIRLAESILSSVEGTSKIEDKSLDIGSSRTPQKSTKNFHSKPCVEQIGPMRTIWAPSERVSLYGINKTNTIQSLSFSVTNTQTKTFSATISSMYENLIGVSLGGSYTSGIMINQQVSVNVAPHKKAWVEFVPRLNETTWQCQTYHWNNESIGKVKIIDSVVGNVVVTNPIKSNISLFGKTFEGPDGVLIWYEEDLTNEDPR